MVFYKILEKQCYKKMVLYTLDKNLKIYTFYDTILLTIKKYAKGFVKYDK